MLFRMIYDNKLAQAAYLIGCQQTKEAIIIDPERDIDRYLEIAANERMRITAIAETHIHADFLSGARELAERTGACLYLSDEGDADWQYRWLDKKAGGGSYDHQLLEDGDTFNIGTIQFQAIHTPGHTPEHLSFLVTDRGSGISEPMGIATGDFVFVGDVGRPDLLETAAGQQGAKEASAEKLHESVQRFKTLPDYLQLWPGHGAGSACGKALGAVPQSTVGYEKRFNAAIDHASDQQRFITSVLHGQPEPPLYFARMKKENRDGPKILGEIPNPKPLKKNDIAAILSDNNVVLDTRPWNEFAEGHLPGALYAPLNTAFPTVAGSYVEPEKHIYLVAEAERVQEAVTDLIRIGLDNIAGYITPEELRAYGGQLEKTKTGDMTALMQLQDSEVQILDVRRADEFAAGHVPNAANIAHTRLLLHVDQLQKDKPVMVHCQTGARSKYATALLQKHGFDTMFLDGGWVMWRQAGKPVEKN